MRLFRIDVTASLHHLVFYRIEVLEGLGPHLGGEVDAIAELLAR